jgi:hypothetical protein
MDLDSKIEYLKRLAPAERKIQQKKIEARMGLNRGDLDEKFQRPPRVAPVSVVEEVKEEPVVVKEAPKKAKRKRTPKRKT